jgi:hypothetical protein
VAAEGGRVGQANGRLCEITTSLRDVTKNPPPRPFGPTLPLRGRDCIALVGCAILIATIAWAGHELPIYPSFYPHEIEIRSLDSAKAGDALRKGDIHAYIGDNLTIPGAPTEQMKAIESLGSFVLMRTNPSSPLLAVGASPCAMVKAAVSQLGPQDGVVLHPYPVTPFQGDYLHHVDLAAVAKARLSEAGESAPPKSKATGSLARAHPEWSAHEQDWDIEVMEVDAARQMTDAAFSENGRLGPPWLRTGWFAAYRLLADAVDNEADKEHVSTALRRLETAQSSGLAERINLERDLVSTLARGCGKMVIGYRVKREYVNVEFSAGIENIGYDAITGLASPIFIRTVKLKDFPWNGWLRIGIAEKPTGAWNPVAGMTDPFGQLTGFAVTDAALIPSPYEAGWMLNRISDLPSDAAR